VNAAVRLAGFSVALVLVFAGAAFAGNLVDVHPGKAKVTAAETGMGAMASTARRSPRRPSAGWRSATPISMGCA
jgi:hypothetical protein